MKNCRDFATKQKTQTLQIPDQTLQQRKKISETKKKKKSQTRPNGDPKQNPPPALLNLKAKPTVAVETQT